MPSSVPDLDRSEARRARKAAEISTARYDAQPEARVTFPVVLGIFLLVAGATLFALLKSRVL
jgi:hypothetical protein